MKPKLTAIFLLVLGLLQMFGDLFNLPAVRGLASATAASPAPKVFSAVHGLETFSTQFFIEWTDADGQFHSTEITPKLAKGLRGPYNRRNVYGAVLAYGPVMAADRRTRPLFDSVSHHALCGNAPLLRELGMNPRELRGSPHLRLAPRPGSNTADLQLSFEWDCQ